MNDYPRKAKSDWKGHRMTDDDINEPDEPTIVLQKDPEPVIQRIEQLSTRILTGDILLPKFQRDFVWEKDQIIKLWDSIAKGYPIGSVLLWLTKQELRSQKKIAELDIQNTKPEYPFNYLLDGQQRLSSICGAVYWKGKEADSRWNLAYDLRAQKFVHLDSLDDPPLHQIRLRKLSTPSDYFAHASLLDSLNAADKDELKKRHKAFYDRYAGYKIAVVTLPDMSIQAVAPIFERINREGTQLDIVDLMRAATWTTDFDLVESIESIQADLEERQYSKLDRKVILRSISAASGAGFAKGGIENLRSHTPEKLKEAVEATRAAYKKAVDFFVKELHIPASTLLPYSGQAVVAAEFFRAVGSPTAQQHAELRKWFWRTSFSGYFGGWSTGDMSRDQDAIHKYVAGSATTMIPAVPLPTADTWKLQQFRSNNAPSKAFAILLASSVPRDLLTGQKIDLSKSLAWNNEKEFHHFFPQDFLKSRSMNAAAINRLANIVMLTSDSNKKISKRAPSDYLGEVANAHGENLPHVLASNLIPQDAFAAALKDDYESFLTRRAAYIQGLVQGMI